MRRVEADYAPPYGPQRRRRRKRSGCFCDETYAKSLQGICKIIALLVGMLAFIMIGASPYYRQIFVLEGVTWPFHIVMLLTICVWLATGFMYALFLTGQHYEWPHVAWPRVELVFNVAMAVVILIAACLEAGNVWRWDMSRGYQMDFNAGSSMYNQYNNLGYRPGMTFSQSLGFNSYCGSYPSECRDYFALLSGHNSYFGNHVFATILLFALLICYLVSSFFAFRTWRVFKRDMHKERDPNAPLPKPSAWARFRYRMSEVKVPTKAGIMDKLSKAVSRDTVANGDGNNDIEVGTYQPGRVNMDDASVVKTNHTSSVYSDNDTQKSHKSHRSSHDDKRSSHDDKRSRSSSEGRKHKHHHEDRDSDYYSSSKSGRRSHHSGSESRSSHHKNRSSDKKNHRHDEVFDAKSKSESSTTSPVASVMV